MKRSFLFTVGGLVLIAVVLIVISTSAFTVHQTQQAIVFQFGDPRAVIDEHPALAFACPDGRAVGAGA